MEMIDIIKKIFGWWLPLTLTIVHQEYYSMPTFNLLIQIWFWFIELCLLFVILIIMVVPDIKVKETYLEKPSSFKSIEKTKGLIFRLGYIISGMIPIVLFGYYQYTALTILFFVNFISSILIIKPLIDKWIKMVKELKDKEMSSEV